MNKAKKGIIHKMRYVETPLPDVIIETNYGDIVRLPYDFVRKENWKIGDEVFITVSTKTIRGGEMSGK